MIDSQINIRVIRQTFETFYSKELVKEHIGIINKSHLSQYYIQKAGVLVIISSTKPIRLSKKLVSYIYEMKYKAFR